MSEARTAGPLARLRALLALLAAAFVLTFSTFASAQDDARRIVAVGDLHGDFEAWREIAQAAGIVDGHGKWVGGDTVLVQLGDVTDRGPDSLKIIHDLQKLQRDAPDDGGQVIVLLGNHEAMNAIGDLRYVHPGEFEALKDRNSKRRRDLVWDANEKSIVAFYAAQDPPLTPEEAKARWYANTPLGSINHRKAWSADGELGEWARSLPAVVQLGDTLFVHGGLSVERALRPLGEINASVSAAIDGEMVENRHPTEDTLGPLWYRGNIFREPRNQVASQIGEEVPTPPTRPSVAEELDQVLAYHGASRLVVGHTPSIEGIVASSGGRLIRADTGIAAHYGGPASFLVLLGGKAFAHQRGVDGEWTSKPLPLGPVASEGANE
ncbi:metallophosphoesterase [Erythrobacter sp. HKB08]|uniref:metallophosphoesterase n=1 Tax=Erythrobacter sp. HKB08 TaxID=2502843 RepID=UPI001008BF4F|nr:metallophosphoesterase [Erythrobacter sp. HKB08]